MQVGDRRRSTRRPLHRDRPCDDLRSRPGRAHQRHRRARRRFRRHVRRRAGAQQRGRRAAVLAVCERFGRDGRAALAGIVAGIETLCRLSMVIPKAIHKAGFHPTSILGTMGATLGASVALGLDRRQTVDALGIAGSMSAGIIEYLAEGAWTKRLHAGWAAQSGVQAARFGAAGLSRPAHRLRRHARPLPGFRALARRRLRRADRRLRPQVVHGGITFKPYATGTMNQPYIDCAMRLSKKGIKADDVDRRAVRDRGRLRAPAVGPARSEAEARERVRARSSARRSTSRSRSSPAARDSPRSPKRPCAIRASSRSPARCATSSTRTIRIPRRTPATSA